jgi:hypothetical protein
MTVKIRERVRLGIVSGHIEELTEEEQVRRGVDQELYKRFADKLAGGTIWRDHVERTVDWKQHGHLDDHSQLLHARLAAKARHTFIPDGRQQLLNVRVSYKLKFKQASVLLLANSKSTAATASFN